MRIFSVNCGRAEPIANAKASGVTGIYKRPLATAVTITSRGVPGDVICDTDGMGYVVGTGFAVSTGPHENV